LKSSRESRLRIRCWASLAGGALLVSAVAAGAVLTDQPLGLLLGARHTIADWLENAESGSSVEAALFRVMQLPGGDILFRRSPRESRPALTALIDANQDRAALYSLRALEDEQALDFDAAEHDWKTFADKSDDKVAADLDLADFYERRLRPQEELAALEDAGRAPAGEQERYTAPESQRSWQAWQRTLQVIQQYALPHTDAVREYAAWEQRYPTEKSLRQREFDFLVDGGDYAAASDLLTRYRQAFAGDQGFPIEAEADLAAKRGSAADGLAVYERSFRPLWPADLVARYYGLLVRARAVPRTADALRAKLAADPSDLNDAARLFYLEQQQGQLDSAKAVLAEYRSRKDEQGSPWSAQELATLGKLSEDIQDCPEAARYYFAMSAGDRTPDSQQAGLAGLARILLTAPEQLLRVGAGNLVLYQDIATMDRGPGYLNGILSLFLNSVSPGSELSQEEQLAVPYFHRAKAAEIITDIDQRFPGAPERPALHASLIDAYAAYGETPAVIREGTAWLAQFPKDPARVDVALKLADAYARTDQPDKEFAVYQDLLRELAARADGVPLGLPDPVYSLHVTGEPALAIQPTNDTADESPQPLPPPRSGARSAQYAQVLDLYLSRLVAAHRLPDALAVLRGEIDRNPQDPGLYERLADFLEQNALNAKQEEVYQRAIQQFQDESWYAKLARFYLRQRRDADYAALSRQVTGIFSGTELAGFLRDAPPDRRLALEVNLYAHRRFPHDLIFVRSLLAEYRRTNQQDQVEKLLWEHWPDLPDLRDQLFELLSSTGRLDSTLATLRQQTPEIDQAGWTALTQRNPAAERFWVEACLWQSHFEDAAVPAEALAAEYPADRELDNTAASLERSLAYFHPEDTAKAIATEERLVTFRPGDPDTLARIGDIDAEHGRYTDAVPYWLRMADAHPGNADGYLQSATVFWDYFDFDRAIEQLNRARQRLAQPTLFAYQTGAVEESRGDVPAAVREYTAGALAAEPSTESHDRLMVLARRPQTRSLVDEATAGLLQSASPAPAAIDLRVGVLLAQQRRDDLARELTALASRTESYDVLDSLTATASAHGLSLVEQAALRRQIALTTDPAHNLQLRYRLVDLLEQHNPAAAAAEIDSIDREHEKILGVVRATVDFDWNHNRRPQAVDVLEQAAQSAYPVLSGDFQLEEAQKLTQLGQYDRSKTILQSLLLQNPLDARFADAMAVNLAQAGDAPGLEAFYRAQLDAVKASALDPAAKIQRVAELRRGMVHAATQLRDYQEAVSQYIELINAYPDDASLAQEAALYAMAHGAQETLFDFYRKTIVQSPRDPRWSIVLARLETAAEDYPSAIAAWSKALQVRPERTDLYIARADLEMRLRRLDDAAQDYQKLYPLTYHDPQWMEKVAEIRARQGRSADAVKALQTGWIEGRPAKPADYFQVAARLESWNLLDDARSFAVQGVDLAGADLLVDPTDQSGAVTYTRIMARLRQSDAAFALLDKARQQAPGLTVASVAQQVEKAGLASVTGDEWRQQRAQQRTQAAGEGLARAMQAMGDVVAAYYAPEEKSGFAAWLRAKAAASTSADLLADWLPAARAAGLADVESDLAWAAVRNGGPQAQSAVYQWLDLARRRVQMDRAAATLESWAETLPPKRRPAALQLAANAFREAGDPAGELRLTERVAATTALSGDALQRFYQLLLEQHPEELVRRSGADAAAQFAVDRADASRALAAVATRSGNLPPVWKNAYTGLTGLYWRDHTPQIRDAFASALGGDATIGERIAHPADRSQELAGEVWFYYGSRFGEYLDEEHDPQAQGYLESELEHTPAGAQAYEALADYSESEGRDDAALVDYQHSLDLKADQPAVLDAVALLLWKQGRQADALAAWQNAVQRLAHEVDERPVPESFWGDFTRVLQDIHARGQYAALSAQVDSLLHVYLVRNGSYRADPLLAAAYHANGDSAEWLLHIAAASGSEQDLLSSIWSSAWIRKDQVPDLLNRLLSLDRATAPQDEAASGNSSELEVHLADALVDLGRFADLRALLARVPHDALNNAEWLQYRLRLARADGTLPQLIDHWQQQPDDAPAEDALRRSVSLLGAAAERTVMAYVFQRAIDSRELTAPNFLGLAAIRLDEGNASAAIDLLRRMTLVSDNIEADTDSAAALLESHRQFPAAVQFLRPLAESSPWNADYRVRLAVALLASGAHSSEALSILRMVAADPKAHYQDRVQAAEALKGSGAPSSGSAELVLLARGDCPHPDEAAKPYFVAARVAAAACASTDEAREPLLREAIATAPSGAQVRLLYVWAAFGAQQNARALLAAQPFLQNASSWDTSQVQPQFDAANSDDAGDDTVDAAAPDAAASAPPVLTADDAAKLDSLAIHALEERHEWQQALQLAQRAENSNAKSPLARQFAAERAHLQDLIARDQENELRAPLIHAQLEQDRVVRPRLRPGDAFTTPKNSDEEDFQ
jgi:cellulose synthase operon protein C